MTLHDAMDAACRCVGITTPRSYTVGRWAKADTDGKNGKGDGRVIIFGDRSGGIAWNWQTGQKARFRSGEAPQARDRSEARKAMEAEKRAAAERHAAVAAICTDIIKICRSDRHDYLRRKGFSDEYGLVCDDPRAAIPHTRLGRAIIRALPEVDGPLLVVPGRIANRVMTLQFIGADGTKKNILGGKVSGACHRISVGRETWVCEGIATGLSVRAALRFLGRPATVLCGFSASNVAAIAKATPGAIIAADHDRPVNQYDGKGTGEFYAESTGRRWLMPPELGDWNDYHQSAGLRAVVQALKEVPP